MTPITPVSVKKDGGTRDVKPYSPSSHGEVLRAALHMRHYMLSRLCAYYCITLSTLPKALHKVSFLRAYFPS